MPLEIGKLSRSCRRPVCRENDFTSPDKGFCAWQNSVYYGYKLHAVFTTDGIFTDFDLTQASVQDIHYLKDIKHLYNIRRQRLSEY
ncbi:transposase [Elizabethkingia argentiflava]|uniref:Transposase n=1 Tax=Elizabethkingia argenteiflava TaxID=2681556 RepID=A0A845PUN4_9FLAO|nr:transposase [Elizabethkingia argenteiflava]